MIQKHKITYILLSCEIIPRRWVMETKINEPWITNKVHIQNGYAYIDHPFWSAEKQQADHKRAYIGKLLRKTCHYTVSPNGAVTHRHLYGKDNSELKLYVIYRRMGVT